MKEKKLFMILLGASPNGRWTEQHDIFFGIGEDLASLLPYMRDAWPEAASINKLHIDAWREINFVDGFRIEIKSKLDSLISENRLFFINLGGYKQNEFDEFHYKIIVVAKNKTGAIEQAKNTAFYKNYDLEGANSHIDDKYGVDVDDLYAIDEILPQKMKETYSIHLIPTSEPQKDEINLGYLKLSTLEK